MNMEDTMFYAGAFVGFAGAGILILTAILVRGFLVRMGFKTYREDPLWVLIFGLVLMVIGAFSFVYSTYINPIVGSYRN